MTFWKPMTLVLLCGWFVAVTHSASAQVLGDYGSLAGLAENTSAKRIGDAHRLAKEQSKLTGQVRPEDEIWLISTRQLCQRSSAAAGSTFQQAEVTRWADCRWHPTSSEQLLQDMNTDPHRLNLLFIHGNRTDLQWANLRGVETYERLVSGPELQGCVPETAPPIRWIIWAWNSDPLHGPRVDLAVKKQRAIDQGTYLAEFFQAIDQASVGVFAYSLGAQALASSLAVRQAENTANVAAESLVCSGPKLDVVMVAGAVPMSWFNTLDAQTRLPVCVNRLTLINNPADRALLVYQRFTNQYPIGLHRRQLDSGIPSETYLIPGNSLDNHYLSHYLEHAETRRLIRQGMLPSPK